MVFSKAGETTVLLRRLRLRLVVFLVRMWLVSEWWRRIFPVALTLNRLAAPRWVFCFGNGVLLPRWRRRDESPHGCGHPDGVPTRLCLQIHIGEISDLEWARGLCPPRSANLPRHPVDHQFFHSRCFTLESSLLTFQSALLRSAMRSPRRAAKSSHDITPSSSPSRSRTLIVSASCSRAPTTNM